jgi:hypothetical protein
VGGLQRFVFGCGKGFRAGGGGSQAKGEEETEVYFRKQHCYNFWQ